MSIGTSTINNSLPSHKATCLGGHIVTTCIIDKLNHDSQPFIVSILLCHPETSRAIKLDLHSHSLFVSLCHSAPRDYLMYILKAPSITTPRHQPWIALYPPNDVKAAHDGCQTCSPWMALEFLLLAIQTRHSFGGSGFVFAVSFRPLSVSDTLGADCAWSLHLSRCQWSLHIERPFSI